MRTAGPRFYVTGFALPSAIFLLVILAGLAAFLVRLSTTQSITSAQDVQGSRAYQAARAGIEWGLYKVLDPANSSVVAPSHASWPSLPSCPADTTLSIEGFSVAVSCTAFGVYSEAGTTRQMRVYRLVATAGVGGVGLVGHVERQMTATVSKCRASDGVAPGYECP